MLNGSPTTISMTSSGSPTNLIDEYYVSDVIASEGEAIQLR